MKWKMPVVIAAAVTCAIVTVKGEEAKVTWEKTCAACHGKDGKGDTKVGKKLGIDDLTDSKVQAKQDEELVKAIKEGAKKDGKTRMQAFGEKLSDDEIKALIAYIRALKK